MPARVPGSLRSMRQRLGAAQTPASGRSSIARIALKNGATAPLPTAMQATATAVNSGDLRSMRNAKCRSVLSEVSMVSPLRARQQAVSVVATGLAGHACCGVRLDRIDNEDDVRADNGDSSPQAG